MIRHVFLWKVAPGCDHDKVIELLSRLSEQIPSLRSWEIGRHQGDPGDNGTPWDGMLISDFDDWQGLQEYSDHPFHVEIVKELKPLVADRAVVDIERGNV
ncbi:Dabb family protein [Streptomyces sp. NBC_01089]|uniref:Dabb family protein n=1 Tax=Streptomyces sp. NBC_01089 TaxID=2903747 RepID=UPI00386FF6D6|nr:Dabb family protein [Streptomyces sp. NBC_01089]